MKYLLDTDICIYIINNRPAHVRKKFDEHAPGDIGLSSVTVSELAFGVTKSGSARNRAALEAFLLALEVKDYGIDAAWHYGDLRTHLEKAGTPVGPLDLMIAAHAVALGATLVSNNTREFKRIRGLKVENWIDN